MAIKYLAGERIIGTAAERAALTTTAFSQTSWKVIARATLNADTTVIDTGTGNGTTSNCVVTENTMYATPKENMMMLVHTNTGSNYPNVKLTFNGDDASSNANYSTNDCTNFTGTYTAQVSQDYIDYGKVMQYGNFFVSNISNIAGVEKLMITNGLNEGGGQGSSIGTAPDSKEAGSKWDTTAGQINRIKLTAGSNFESGSEIVILGCDPDESDSGTAFWQKIAEGTASSGSVTTGSFTPKKYMWIETHMNGTGNDAAALQFNTDTGGNYNTRFSEGFTTNQTWALSGGISIGRAMSSNNPDFCRCIMVNPNGASKTKFIISQNSSSKGGTGMGNAPYTQSLIGKWFKSGEAQITEIKVVDSQGIGNTPWASGSKITVWGSD